MTIFRPCIDLHDGYVKQIVGGTLETDVLKTNFVSDYSPSYYANLYKTHDLRGGHVIMLGKGNESACREILNCWNGVFHVGGGINMDNARNWLEAGADKVIVTSYLFPDAKFSLSKLEDLCDVVEKKHLVIDLSCRRGNSSNPSQSPWIIAINKWQNLTDTVLTTDIIKLFEQYCSEFLIHAVDYEGLCNGMDEELVKFMGNSCTIPSTYAGGGRKISDLFKVNELSRGKVDVTFGSSLDIFGGSGVTLTECIEWNNRMKC